MNLWTAVYSDGTSLSRYNDDGSENGYADIDRSRLVRFDVIDKRTIQEVDSSLEPAVWTEKIEHYTVASVCFERPTQKLVYRRRNFINGYNEHIGMIVIVGWQETIDGDSLKSLMYIYPDGHIELDGSRNDLELIPIEE